MTEIPLTRGKVAKVDPADYEILSKFEWHYDSNGYAYRRKATDDGGNLISMHREIAGHVPKDKVVDHINRDKLDNRRSNLRITAQSNNAANSKPRKGTSKYKGVSWRKTDGKWASKVERLGKKYSLGLFNCEENAALAYNIKAKDLFGEYAYLNEVSISEIDRSKEHKWSSEYTGVSYDKVTGRWRSHVRVKDSRIDLGRYAEEEDATRMVDFWTYAIHGDSAVLNRNVEVVHYG